MHLNLSFNKFEVVCLEVKSIPQLKLHRIPLWITSEVESVSKAKRWSVQFLSNALEWLFSKHTKYNIAMLYFVCFQNNPPHVARCVHCGAKCIENRPQLWLTQLSQLWLTQTQTQTLLPKHLMPFSGGKYQSFLCVNLSGKPSTDNLVCNEKLSLVIFSAHHCTQT